MFCEENHVFPRTILDLFISKLSASWLSIITDETIWLDYFPMYTSIYIIDTYFKFGFWEYGLCILSLLSPSQCEHGRAWASLFCALCLTSSPVKGSPVASYCCRERESFPCPHVNKPLMSSLGRMHHSSRLLSVLVTALQLHLKKRVLLEVLSQPASSAV